MVFSSIVFLGIFLPITLILYFIVKNRKWRNAILLLASLIFYSWGEPVWVFAIISITLIDYFAGLLMQKSNNKTKRRAILTIAIMFNLSVLFVFKYSNFVITNLNMGLGTNLGHFSIVMPIGISFFTFQALTYIIDVYRKDVRAQRNYGYLLMYISMFPQLIAGPIVRYSDVENGIMNRKESPAQFAQGAFRFACGIAKKVVLANYAGIVVTTLLTDQFEFLSAAGSWIGILLFAFQLYFDFSGYSDMAIGLGLMFGFHFRENFNYPFISRSITEFWRRWHISLGTFFRDYVYIPMGGNRRRHYFNILCIWALTGFWHGADWNYIIWGLYFAVLLIIERTLLKIDVDISKLPVISHAYSFLMVLFCFVIFYFNDIGQMLIFFKNLFGLGGININLGIREITAINQIVWLIPFMALAATPLPAAIGRKLFGNGTLSVALKAFWSAGIVIVCFLLILGQSYNPFIYFRF